VSLRPSTHLAASKMLAAAPAATALFSLPDDDDDSERPSPYFNDRPLERADPVEALRVFETR
jgi:hypothetical protein